MKLSIVALACVATLTTAAPMVDIGQAPDDTSMVHKREAYVNLDATPDSGDMVTKRDPGDTAPVKSLGDGTVVPF